MLITLILYPVPPQVAGVGIVAVIVWFVKLVPEADKVPRVVGEAKLPEASESWAIN